MPAASAAAVAGPGALQEIENLADNALTGIREGGVSTTRGARPGEPIHDTVQSFLEELIPDGVYAAPSRNRLASRPHRLPAHRARAVGIGVAVGISVGIGIGIGIASASASASASAIPRREAREARDRPETTLWMWGEGACDRTVP